MATGTVVDVVMPQMGVSVSEGTITRWMKQVGDHIEADETIVEISTDKVDTEVPSPASGIVREILADDGDTVPVNTRIAVIAVGDAGDADEPSTEPADTPPAATDNAEETPATPETAQTMSSQPAPEPQAARESNGDEDDSGRTFISPVVARMLAEHRLDVNKITGSGRGGRVTKKDVQAFIDSGGAQAEPVIHDVPHFAPPAEETVVSPSPPTPPAPAPAATAAPAPAPPTQQTLVASSGDEELYQFNTIRKVIARHMRHSLDTAAHVTTVIEVDMTGVVNLRKKWKPEYQKRYGVNLTYIPFIARATIDAIGSWPWVNAEVQGETALIKRYVNLGMAVAVDDAKGLMVPVIH
ncbi:MAG TPA: 2-oxo acid dehydrogenase subunit E2, partial [Gaiellales bacterium]|nr:2-oxo acid dehydrogenase subunit E2 [Gaiellales bacterium]